MVRIEGAGEEEVEGGLDGRIEVDVAKGLVALLGDEEDEGASVVGATHAPDETESLEGADHDADRGLHDPEAVAQLTLKNEHTGLEDGANHIEPPRSERSVRSDRAPETRHTQMALLDVESGGVHAAPKTPHFSR